MTNELDLLRSYMDGAPTPAPDDLARSLSHLHAAMSGEAADTGAPVGAARGANTATGSAPGPAPDPLLRPVRWRAARHRAARHRTALHRTALTVVVAAAAVAAVMAVVAFVVTAGPNHTPAGRAIPGDSGTLSWRLVDSTTSPFRSLPQGGQTDLQCVTDLVCYSPGANRDELYRTTDGGESWQATAPVPFAPGGDGLQFSFSCATAEMCALIGSAPSGAPASELAEIIVTSDGGAHWRVSSIPAPTGIADPYAGRFTCGNATHCLLSVGGSSSQAVGGAAASTGASRVGTFLTTSDGGSTWTQATAVPSTPAGAVWTMKCSATGSCLAVAALGEYANTYVVALRSENWGLTWVAGPPGAYNDAAILYASCGDATHCMLVPVVGSSKVPYEIVTTANAGLTWQVTAPPAGWENMPTAVSCANGDDCWIAMSTYDTHSAAGSYSAPGIEATNNGGATWSSITLPTAKPPIADVLTLSCPPTGDGCMGIGNLQDHMMPPSGPPHPPSGPPHPLSGPLVISNLPVAEQNP
jgi:photosystem II stability/assembly factor-like uncharacterized protein